MKVKEMIELLKSADPDSEVLIESADGQYPIDGAQEFAPSKKVTLKSGLTTMEFLDPYVLRELRSDSKRLRKILDSIKTVIDTPRSEL